MYIKPIMLYVAPLRAAINSKSSWQNIETPFLYSSTNHRKSMFFKHMAITNTLRLPTVRETVENKY